MPELAVIGKRLPAAKLDERLAELRETYGATSTDIAIKRDHACARLLAESGWTQQELALRLGKSQQWVSCQIVFGRFLNFTTAVVNIREKQFRACWVQTNPADSDAARFADVQRLLDQSPDQKAKPTRLIGDRLMARFADGRWHPLDGMAATLNISQAEAKATLDLMLLRGAYHSKCERKQVGLRPHYRIFRKDRTVSVNELTEKLGPIIDELFKQGKTNAATISIMTVGHCGAQLKKLLDEWSK